MTNRKLRKNADISPPQSPHDGIHTCSKGCKKPGCTRTLRETIEEQDRQIEALKRDVLEKTAELRKSEEHNDALCERMQDLNSELFAASNINGKLHMKRVHDLNHMGGQCEEIARLKADVERLTKAGDELHAFLINYIVESRISSSYLNKLDDDWHAAKEGKGQP
jgi:uncharacterized coiled-coil protein SlyX